MTRVEIVLVTIFSLFGQFVYGLDRYVSVNGSDITGNGSIANPWQTIQYAVNATNGITTETVNIYVAEGTYGESVTVGDGSNFSKICFYGCYDDSAIPWIRDLNQFKTIINPPSGYDHCIEVYWNIPAIIDGFYGNHGSFGCGNGYETGWVSNITVLGEGGVSADVVEYCYIANGSIIGRNKAENNVVYYGGIRTGVDGIVRNNILIGPSGYNVGIDGLPTLMENNKIVGFSTGVYVARDAAQAIGNQISGCGTGIYVDGTSVWIEKNVIEGCEWGVYGGGWVENNVIASCGRGMWSVGYANNNIYWGNGIDFSYSALPTYSCFEYDMPGEGNIKADYPAFVGWEEFSTTQPIWVDINYTGENSDGTYDKPYKRIIVALSLFDYHLAAGSPCIGAGAGGVDIGAYPEATSYTLAGYREVKVMVKPGVYEETQVPVGMGVQLVGAEGPANTIIRSPGISGPPGVKMFRGSQLEGLTIGRDYLYGQGIELGANTSEVMITDCIIEENYRGMECYDGLHGDNIRVENSIICNNAVDGILCASEVIGCLIEGNGSAYSGVGAGADVVRDNIIRGNTYGAGGDLVEGNIIYENRKAGVVWGLEIRNNIIYNNEQWGIYLYCSSDDARIENNTLYGNISGGIEGERIDGPWTDMPERVEIKNCILYGNAGPDIDKEKLPGVTVTYNCIQDGDPGVGNISLNPEFANAASGDFHLKSMGGRWDPTANGGSGAWVIDTVHSPCVDAGEPASDYSNEPEPNGGRINVGAYGNTPYASKSIATPTPTPTGSPTSTPVPTLTPTPTPTPTGTPEIYELEVNDGQLLSVAGDYDFLFSDTPGLQLSGTFTQDSRGKISFTGTITEDGISTSITTRGKLRINRRTDEVIGKLKRVTIGMHRMVHTIGFNKASHIKLKLLVSNDDLNVMMEYKKKGEPKIIVSSSRLLVCPERGARIVIEDMTQEKPGKRYIGSGTLYLPCGLEVPVTVKEKIKTKNDGSLIRRYKIKASDRSRVRDRSAWLKLKTYMPSSEADTIELLKARGRISYLKKLDPATVIITY